jgi:hypothetical protein
LLSCSNSGQIFSHTKQSTSPNADIIKAMNQNGAINMSFIYASPYLQLETTRNQLTMVATGQAAQTIPLWLISNSSPSPSRFSAAWCIATVIKRHYHRAEYKSG